MTKHKLDFLIVTFSLILFGLACSFTTGNISSVKVGKSENSSAETAKFEQNDAVHIYTTISNTSGKHKVAAKLFIEEIKGMTSGKEIPGGEFTTEIDGAGTVTFDFTPPDGGWYAGKYKVEVTMNDTEGKQIDKKTVFFTASGRESGGQTEDKKTQDTEKKQEDNSDN